MRRSRPRAASLAADAANARPAGARAAKPSARPDRRDSPGLAGAFFVYAKLKYEEQLICAKRKIRAEEDRDLPTCHGT